MRRATELYDLRVKADALRIAWLDLIAAAGFRDEWEWYRADCPGEAIVTADKRFLDALFLTLNHGRTRHDTRGT